MTMRMYHDLPFEGLERKKGSRSKTRERIERIANLIDIKNTTVLDLGCAEGGMSLGMVEKGAFYVLGVDHEQERLDTGKDAAKKLGYDEVVEFKLAEIDLDFVKKLQQFDIIIWYSQLHHIVAAKGLEYGEELLLAVSKKGDVMFFDGVMRTEKSRQYKKGDLWWWLKMNTVYDTFNEYEPLDDWGGGRLTFMCSKSF